jgi:hypothetical protein
VFLLQQSLTEQIERTNAENSFKTQVLLASDLSGFDPPPYDRSAFDHDRGKCVAGRPRHASRVTVAGIGDDLRSWYFGAKVLEAAHLDGFDLTQATFRDSIMRGATLTCTRLVGANFVHADLTDADLSAANLERADLRGATLDGTVSTVKSWKGAIVNASTCWPEAMAGHVASLELDGRRFDPPGPRLYGPSYGHVCSKRTLLRADGTKTLNQVPTAAGEANVYEATAHDPLLQALGQLTEEVRRLQVPSQTPPDAVVASQAGDVQPAP